MRNRRTRTKGARGNRRRPAAGTPVTAAVAARPPWLRRRLWPNLFFFALVLTLFLANGKTLRFSDGGDTIPNRLVPFSVLRFGTLTLEPFRASFEQAGGYRWYVQVPRGTLVSLYPIGTPLVALPFYVPVFAYHAARGQTSAEALFAASEGSEKLVAAAMTALAVLIVWRLVQRETSPRPALAIALGLATCTLMWPIASQILWQQTAAALLLAIGAGLLAGPLAARHLYGAGLVFGLLASVRPPAAVFLAAAAAAVGWMALRKSPRFVVPHLARFGLGTIPPIALTVVYNWTHYGSWLGGYQLAAGIYDDPAVMEGALGLMLSPNRGLLVYSPVCLVGFIGGVYVLRRWRQQPGLAALLVAAVPYFLVHAAAASWAGGWSFGPRFVTELMPLLALAAPAGLAAIGRIGRILLIPAVVWSLLIQISGAFWYPASAWNVRMDPHHEEHAWDWRHFMPWEDFQAWQRQRQP